MESDDPLETCPYDPVHRIMRSVMPRHLVKCRRNFPSKKLKICMYNATHIINPIEYDYHIEHCEDARELVTFIRRPEPNIVNHFIPIEDIQNQHVPQTENWDAEPDVPAYDPNEYVEKNNILRYLPCASKSEKRRFREKERLRFQELEAKQEVKTVAPEKKKQPIKQQPIKQQPPKPKIPQPVEKDFTLEDIQDINFEFNSLSMSDLSNTATSYAKEEHAFFGKKDGSVKQIWEKHTMQMKLNELKKHNDKDGSVLKTTCDEKYPAVKSTSEKSQAEMPVKTDNSTIKPPTTWSSLFAFNTKLTPTPKPTSLPPQSISMKQTGASLNAPLLASNAIGRGSRFKPSVYKDLVQETKPKDPRNKNTQKMSQVPSNAYDDNY